MIYDNSKTMKNIFYIFFLLGAAFIFAKPEQLQAQNTYPQSYERSTGELARRNFHNVKINFLSPFVLTANGAYEYYINPNLSIQLGAFYNGINIEKNFLWFDLPSARYRSYAITPEVRFYLGNPARPQLDGFYIAPFTRYQNTSISTTLNQEDEQGNPQKYEGDLSSIRLGAVGGYKLILRERFSLEAFAGPSLRITNWLNSNLNTYNAEDFLPFGLALRSGMTLGYMF